MINKNNKKGEAVCQQINGTAKIFMEKTSRKTMISLTLAGAIGYYLYNKLTKAGKVGTNNATSSNETTNEELNWRPNDLVNNDETVLEAANTLEETPVEETEQTAEQITQDTDQLEEMPVEYVESENLEPEQDLTEDTYSETDPYVYIEPENVSDEQEQEYQEESNETVSDFNDLQNVTDADVSNPWDDDITEQDNNESVGTDLGNYDNTQFTGPSANEALSSEYQYQGVNDNFNAQNPFMTAQQPQPIIQPQMHVEQMNVNVTPMQFEGMIQPEMQFQPQAFDQPQVVPSVSEGMPFDNSFAQQTQPIVQPMEQIPIPQQPTDQQIPMGMPQNIPEDMYDDDDDDDDTIQEDANSVDSLFSSVQNTEMKQKETLHAIENGDFAAKQEFADIMDFIGRAPTVKKEKNK